MKKKYLNYTKFLIYTLKWKLYNINVILGINRKYVRLFKTELFSNSEISFV